MKAIDFGPHGSWPLNTRTGFLDYRSPERESGIDPDYAQRRRQVLRRRAFREGHEYALWILWCEARHTGKQLHTPPQCRAMIERFESIWPELESKYARAMEELAEKPAA